MCAGALRLTFNVAPERLLTIWSCFHPPAVRQRFARAFVHAGFQAAASTLSEATATATATATAPASISPLPSDVMNLIAEYTSFDLPYLPLDLLHQKDDQYDEAAGASRHAESPTADAFSTVHEQLDRNLTWWHDENFAEDIWNGADFEDCLAE
jgi:hypothetical protein